MSFLGDFRKMSFRPITRNLLSLEDRLKILETENASLKKYNDYHQVVHEIHHMSDLHVDSSFYK